MELFVKAKKRNDIFITIVVHRTNFYLSHGMGFHDGDIVDVLYDKARRSVFICYGDTFVVRNMGKKGVRIAMANFIKLNIHTNTVKIHGKKFKYKGKDGFLFSLHGRTKNVKAPGV